jgi:hypothetical protein
MFARDSNKRAGATLAAMALALKILNPAPALAGGGVIQQLPRAAQPLSPFGQQVQPNPRLRQCEMITGTGEGFTAAEAHANADRDLGNKVSAFGPHIVKLMTGPNCTDIRDIGAHAIRCKIRWQVCSA